MRVSIHGIERPRLARKARLRRDRIRGRTVLLYPENGLVLNETAADCIALCTGDRTLDDIVEELARRYPGAPRERIQEDVRGLLASLLALGLLRP